MGWGIFEIALSPNGQHRIDPVYLDRVFFFLVALLVLSWGAIGCWFDVAQRRLPNWWLVLGAAGLTVAIGIVLRQKPASVFELAGVVGAVGTGIGLWFGFYLGAFLLNPRSIGAGDVKLAAILGGSVGLVSGEAVTTGIWIAVAIVLAAGLTLLMAGINTRRRAWGDRRKAKTVSLSASVPHGPVMLAATAIVWGMSGGYLQVP